LLRLLRDVESSRVERKEGLGDTSGIRKAVCPFSNDIADIGKPCLLFVGVRDNGTCLGLTVSDEMLRTLADIRSQGNILPMPRIEVEKRTLDGCELALVIVHPSDAPPVRYEGNVYIRVAGSNRIASESEIRVLTEKRRGWDRPYDLHVVGGSALDDIDLAWFRDTYLRSAVGESELVLNNRTAPERLASLRLVSPPPESAPTVLGILVSGFDPRSLIPGAYVQFLRIDGTELTDPIKDQKEISGPVSYVLSELDDVVRAHISSSVKVNGSKTEIRRPDYPIGALQQLIRNAILHRTYEATHSPTRISWFRDRIEILNPGGPFGQVKCENFGEEGVTDYRNPHLAEALKNLGYVQRFGLGIPLARSELRKNGNPEPEFEPNPSQVLTTVRPAI